MSGIESVNIFELSVYIWHKIFEFSEFKSQINLRSCCKYFRNNMFIIDLYNIDELYLDKLNDSIIAHYPKMTIFLGAERRI